MATISRTKNTSGITCLFLDIGGVLLSDGWDHHAGKRAATKFKLDLAEMNDFFISSCFVHVRKPDAEMFRLALDIAQTPARHVVYIDNTPMFIEIAKGLGIRGIQHTDYQSTRAELAAFGLECAGGKEDRS